MPRSISKEVKDFHQFLKEYWDRKNPQGSFEDTFNPDFNEHDPKTIEGEAVKFSLDVMISLDEIKLIQLFCEKYKLDFSISPMASFWFYIKGFTKQPV